jgi:hypothetical protein
VVTGWVPKGKMKNTSEELSESKKSVEPSKQESPAESTADEKKKPICVEIALLPVYKKPKE